MSKLNVTHEYGTLKECMLADFYTADFWDEWIPSQHDKTVDEIKDIFKRISDEIAEDFESISSTMQEHGIVVHRPDTATIQEELSTGAMTGQDDNANSTTIMDLIANVDAPMNPGFDIWVMNNTLYTAEEKDVEYGTLFADLEMNGYRVERDANQTSLKKFPFQSVIRNGNEVWADIEELNDAQLATLRGLLPEDCELLMEPDCGNNFVKWLNPNLIHYSGHDHDLGPNMIHGIDKIYSHGMTIPTWLRETKNINDMTQFTEGAITEMLALNGNKWWVDRYMETGDTTILSEVKAFTQYWADFTEGVTPFDQDGVSLNNETFMTFGTDADQVEVFKAHGIDVVSVPFRHRFLWGHNFTGYVADLVRE